MNKIQEFRAGKAGQKPSRIYRVRKDGEFPLYRASFQPLHPVLGHPWQASRDIVEGFDCYRVGKYGNDSAPVIVGEVPKIEAWHGEAGMDWCFPGFSTLEKALAAIASHCQKSKFVVNEVQ